MNTSAALAPQSTPVEPAAPGPYRLVSTPMSRGTGRANHCCVHTVWCAGTFVLSFTSKRDAERYVREMNAQAAIPATPVAAPAPVPHVIRVSSVLAMVECSDTPGQYYCVEPTSCTCPSHVFGIKRDPAHVCKHRRLLGFFARCANCQCEPVMVAGDWCRGCWNLRHSCEGQAAVEEAQRVVAMPPQAYEGAEKALRTPVATSITRVVVKGDVFGDWA